MHARLMPDLPRPLPSPRRRRSTRWQGRALLVVMLAGGALPLALAEPALASNGHQGSGPSSGSDGRHEHQGPDGEKEVNVCSDVVQPGFAHCLAHVRTDSKAKGRQPVRSGASSPRGTIGNNGAYDPKYLQSAYNAPSSTGGVSQTVAIVDAYDDPNAEANLANYRSFFKLPPCTTASGCFRKVDENGGTNYPAADVGWSQEISLDLDMVSAMCPNCNILLVEAKQPSIFDLGTAVNRAVALGANVVSNSYGGGEYQAETSDDAYYNHPGVAVVASSGDSGYGTSYPAASPYVTAVGGTSLTQNTNTGTRNGTETAWSGAGSGCSVIEPKASWQQKDPGCASNRTIADVSAVADPHTGVWVYDTYGQGGWLVFGGTSVAAPIVGSVYALAGTPAPSTYPARYPYASPGYVNDVTSGSNGSCGGSYLCTAMPGYDGPTGLGTPNGTFAFSSTTPTVPSAPQKLSASGGNGQVSLSWSPPVSSGGSAVTSYNVYRATTAGGETFVAGVTATTYTDLAVTNGTTYFYLVTAVNSMGGGQRPPEVSATPQAPAVPSAPQGLSATPGNAQVSLSWSAPASNGGPAVTSYNVYRGTNTGGENLYVTVTVTVTSYTDTVVTNGTKYYYQVSAVNSVGESLRSAEVSATPATVPGAPSLTAQTSTTRGVALSWTAPSNGGSAITSYTIYRSRSSGAEITYITVNCTSGTCTYNDSNTSSYYTYYYKVAATNAVGTGPKSNEASARAR